MGEPGTGEDDGLRAQAERAHADFQAAADDLLARLEKTREHAEFLTVMHVGAPELADRWRREGGPQLGDGGGDCGV